MKAKVSTKMNGFQTIKTLPISKIQRKWWDLLLMCASSSHQNTMCGTLTQKIVCTWWNITEHAHSISSALHVHNSPWCEYPYWYFFLHSGIGYTKSESLVLKQQFIEFNSLSSHGGCNWDFFQFRNFWWWQIHIPGLLVPEFFLKYKTLNWGA